MKTILLNDKTNSEAIRIKKQYKDYISKDGGYTSRKSYIVLDDNNKAIKLNLYIKNRPYQFIDIDLI